MKTTFSKDQQYINAQKRVKEIKGFLLSPNSYDVFTSISGIY